MKIPPVGIELFHAKRGTNRQSEMTEIIVTNVPKKGPLIKA